MSNKGLPQSADGVNQAQSLCDERIDGSRQDGWVDEIYEHGELQTGGTGRERRIGYKTMSGVGSCPLVTTFNSAISHFSHFAENWVTI